MTTPRYSVTQHPIDTLLTWAKSGDIAIPEIQRPFVWSAVKVRNLLDSLYQGYPIGYLISWRNPTIKLKDGTLSAGKRILIDGQQRVTALMAALLGCEVLTKNYRSVRIRIAFHPQEERFEVRNPAIARDRVWIDDITKIFHPTTSLFQLSREYLERNPNADPITVEAVLLRVSKIGNNLVGIIELAEDLDIETVTEIFIRVNSEGKSLSQADFAMSKIAVNESYEGNLLRKAIDYFCHLAVAPEYYSKVEEGDPDFTSSPFWSRMRWLKGVNDDLYDPTYTDMLRVAFASEFGRGRLRDLVGLLSGRNFETKEYEERIVEKSFGRLKQGVLSFINETHFQRFVMIIRSAGFMTASLLRGHSALNFAYILYLMGRKEKLTPSDLERLVRRWYAMSLLTRRYTGSSETVYDQDVRGIREQGLLSYCDVVIVNELPDSFWSRMLPQLMKVSVATSPYFLAFQAAQAELGDKGFLSNRITVNDLLAFQGDRHHLYPRNYLKKKGLTRGRYNQIANLAVTQSEINICIGDDPPKKYFPTLISKCEGKNDACGSIKNKNQLRENLNVHCIPFIDELLGGKQPEYGAFLRERRKLMALKIKNWFEKL